MVSAPRLITQVILVGGRIVARAFVDAYKAAAANTAKSAVSAHSASKDSLTRLTGMDAREACKILGLEGDIEKMNSNELEQFKKQVVEKYEKLFDLNNAEKGGSFYLQSKIYRAKERMDLELERFSKRQKA